MIPLVLCCLSAITIIHLLTTLAPKKVQVVGNLTQTANAMTAISVPPLQWSLSDQNKGFFFFFMLECTFLLSCWNAPLTNQFCSSAVSSCMSECAVLA